MAVNSNVYIVPWTADLMPLVSKWRECVRTSDNFRAALQTPEWVGYRWKSITNTFLAVLSDSAMAGPAAVTPLVEKKCQLIFSIGRKKFGEFKLNSLLLVGNVPLLGLDTYQALCDAALALPGIDCLHLEGVPKSSAFWKFLVHAERENPRWLFYRPGKLEDQYCYIELPESHAEYLRGFNKRARSNFRRKLRLLEKAGGPFGLCGSGRPQTSLRFSLQRRRSRQKRGSAISLVSISVMPRGGNSCSSKWLSRVCYGATSSRSAGKRSRLKSPSK